MASRSILVGPEIWEELNSCDESLKSKFIRVFRFLSKDMSHPFLRVEVIKGRTDTVWHARVDLIYRIHFEKRKTYYLILAVGPDHLQEVG